MTTHSTETTTNKQDDTQLTRLQALKNEIGAMTPVQRDFISGKLSQADLLHEQEPVTRAEQERRLRTVEERLNSHNARNNLIEDRCRHFDTRIERTNIELSALQARVGKLSQADLLHEQEPVTRAEQERRLRSLETRVADIASKAIDAKYKAETHSIDISALQARVRRLESDAPIKEILVVGLAGVLFMSLIVAVANAVAEPV